MSDLNDSSGNVPDEMAEYLQTFLDETDEQLDDLVETLLALENDAGKQEELNEAFRLVHSIKGSAGMMGFQSMADLAHHLENRFEHFRSGSAALDEPTMNLVLRCVDFLRECNSRLRTGAALDDAGDLVQQLGDLEENASAQEPPLVSEQRQSTAGAKSMRIAVRFRAGLQLVDLKAQLILRRLAEHGEVLRTDPQVTELADTQGATDFEIEMATDQNAESLREVVAVDGVESVSFPDGSTSETPSPANADPSMTVADLSKTVFDESLQGQEVASTNQAANVAAMEDLGQDVSDVKTAGKVGQSMRVDIDRLDNLMNLAGELVVNRARFVQVAGQISPALRKASTLNQLRDFSENLRRTVDCLQTGEAIDERMAQVQQLRTGLELMDEQIALLENGRRCLGQFDEAIDQLARVSSNLQRGVLDTRMLPVGPLFNRFRRVVRDLSKEHRKQIDLRIRGENTELDKRMIDDLFDPLMHLVRNAVDHGLEPPEERSGQGKPEVGVISLEAAHSGNNVFIHVRDDGRGIDAGMIRHKLIEKAILAESAAGDLSDEQALQYIWHPGFSTSATVTDVSGRGVGMDVVKTRISMLNGNIEVASTVQQGTAFTLRLPLTLAIINSLLVRLQSITFSMPIDDVREIVLVAASDVVRVSGKQAFEIRGEFIPLVRAGDVFHWHGIDYGRSFAETPRDQTSTPAQVVILQSGGRMIGLQVDELLGSQDIVVKSLSDNFVDIRGLSGASILGDGSVCLMLDVGALIEMAGKSPAAQKLEKAQS